MEWNVKVIQEEEHNKVYFVNTDNVSIQVRIDRDTGWKFYYEYNDINFRFYAQQLNKKNKQMVLAPPLGSVSSVHIDQYQFPIDITLKDKFKIQETISDFLLNFHIFKGAKPPHVERVVFSETTKELLTDDVTRPT